MGKQKSYRKMKLLFAGYILAVLNGWKVNSKSANEFLLSRDKRANSIGSEFGVQGNLEAECIEEVCNREEHYEVWDDARGGESDRESYSVLIGCKSKFISLETVTTRKITLQKLIIIKHIEDDVRDAEIDVG